MTDNDNMIEGKTEEELIAQLKTLQDSRRIVWKDANDKGKVLNTYDNFKLLVAHYGITIKYNEMSKHTEIEIPNERFCQDLEMAAKRATLISMAHTQGFPVTHIDEYIEKLANENVYHPVRDWINTLKWDGVDRLPDYYNMVVTDGDQELKNILMRKWLLSAVAALYHPDFSCEGVLTWVGAQGVGKTTFILRLIPKEYRYRWNKDGVIINTSDKDSLLKALSYWICELGEIDATFKKSDIEALKAFLTNSFDVIRRPYGRTAEQYARKTVFYASVNDEEFLRDDQNRRFWVVPVVSFTNNDIDIEQLWAQMKHDYEQVKGKITTSLDREENNEWGWFLSPNERLRLYERQEMHKIIDPVAQQLDNRLKLPVDVNIKTAEWLNATAVCEKIGIPNINKSHTNAASRWLKSKGYDRKKDTKQFLVEFKDSEFFETNRDHVKVVSLPKRGFVL